jgi:uncharacterized protein YukE
MVDDQMTSYDKQTIFDLLNSLDSQSKGMQNQHDTLAVPADQKIMSVWHGTGSQAYHAAFQKYSQAHDNVMQVLKGGRDAVEQAYLAILHADGKIGSSFGG